MKDKIHVHFRIEEERGREREREREKGLLCISLFSSMPLPPPKKYTPPCSPENISLSLSVGLLSLVIQTPA